MSNIYLKDIESSSVIEARADRDRLSQLNIRSPDVSAMYKLKVDRNTMMYFKDIGHRALFISKYYNRNTRRYSFEKKPVIENDY